MPPVPFSLEYENAAAQDGAGTEQMLPDVAARWWQQVGGRLRCPSIRRDHFYFPEQVVFYFR